MKKKDLYMVSEDGEYDHLSTTKTYYKFHRPAIDKDATLEAMAAMLDQDSEGMNAHDFCGCHVRLSKLIAQVAGRTAATRIMRRLVDFDGLMGQNGVCGAGPGEDVVARELAVKP